MKNIMHWHQNYEEGMSFSDTIADKVANFIGSWKFLFIQTSIFIVWVIVNTMTAFGNIQWDAYPYILFNLFMSAEAAYATPLIMMSQNRQSIRDRHQADADFNTNVAAKQEIELLQQDLSRIENEKLDMIIKLLQK